MKSLIVTILVASIAYALPQVPPPSPVVPIANNPTTAGPTAPSPKTIGQLPKDGISLPYPDFGQLASLLGFDPAKATPDASG
jgi:hypothetical protein